MTGDQFGLLNTLASQSDNDIGAVLSLRDIFSIPTVLKHNGIVVCLPKAALSCRLSRLYNDLREAARGAWIFVPLLEYCALYLLFSSARLCLQIAACKPTVLRWVPTHHF